MQSIVNSIKGKAIDIAAHITPVLKESKFKETGVITPEEFVAAGDHLVSTCPTWQWAGGEDSYVKSYLPRDKQYLSTRNVPCYKRCKEMEYAEELEKVIEEGAGEGWVDTHYYTTSVNDKEQEMSFGSAGGSSIPSLDNANEEDDDDDSPALDMDEFLENMPEDAATVIVKKPTEPAPDKGDSAIMATRTYDLNITYDNYYRTPRLWLTGYDENHKPLRTDQLFEDISQDFAKKTVTMESHPHLSGPPQASVHPCRHAQAMKKIIETVEEGGGELSVHMYLIIFLKFVQAVIPTLEYDYTANFSMAK